MTIISTLSFLWPSSYYIGQLQLKIPWEMRNSNADLSHFNKPLFTLFRFSFEKMREKADITVSAAIWPHPFLFTCQLESHALHEHMSIQILSRPVQIWCEFYSFSANLFFFSFFIYLFFSVWCWEVCAAGGVFLSSTVSMSALQKVVPKCSRNVHVRKSNVPVVVVFLPNQG